MKIKRLNKNAIIPTQGSAYSAGYDLYAPENIEPIIINPHETVKIDIGWAMEIPIGYFGAIFPRSGIATKRGLRPANCVGVIDSDYRGPIIVALHNDTNNIQTIEPGERIAQLIIMAYSTISFDVVDFLEDTERGSGGFGSTGTK